MTKERVDLELHRSLGSYLSRLATINWLDGILVSKGAIRSYLGLRNVRAARLETIVKDMGCFWHRDIMMRQTSRPGECKPWGLRLVMRTLDEKHFAALGEMNHVYSTSVGDLAKLRCRSAWLQRLPVAEECRRRMALIDSGRCASEDLLLDGDVRYRRSDRYTDRNKDHALDAAG